MITALLQTIKHSSESDLQHLVSLIREPSQPDAVASCLRKHFATLQTRAIIPRLDVDETDVMSFALQGLCGHRKTRPKPQDLPPNSSTSPVSGVSTISTGSGSDAGATRPKPTEPSPFGRGQHPTDITPTSLRLMNDDDGTFGLIDEFDSPKMFADCPMDEPPQLDHQHHDVDPHHQLPSYTHPTTNLSLDQTSAPSDYAESSHEVDSSPFLSPVTTATDSPSTTFFSAPPQLYHHDHQHHPHPHPLPQHLPLDLLSYQQPPPHTLASPGSTMAFGDTLAYQHYLTYGMFSGGGGGGAGLPAMATMRNARSRTDTGYSTTAAVALQGFALKSHA